MVGYTVVLLLYKRMMIVVVIGVRLCFGGSFHTMLRLHSGCVFE